VKWRNKKIPSAEINRISISTSYLKFWFICPYLYLKVQVNECTPSSHNSKKHCGLMPHLHSNHIFSKYQSSNRSPTRNIPQVAADFV
jgi:hypothetical protein